MSFGIKPLGDRVVIKRLEAEEKTQGGIILTSQAKEQPQMADVVAVGPGTKDDKMELKVGDVVIFSKYAGTEVKYEGEEYTILSQKDILATTIKQCFDDEKRLLDIGTNWQEQGNNKKINPTFYPKIYPYDYPKSSDIIQ